ncbi:MAG: DNA polymerase III subunit alpha [Candidatus Aenigmatarchaeota archaeon]
MYAISANSNLMCKLCHLHVHTDRSLLDGFASPTSIVDKAISIGSNAIAITDHGNLFGLPVFYDYANAHNIKPILGCEFYLTEEIKNKEDIEKGGSKKKDITYHLLALAKNDEGLKNLYALSTYSYLHGFYYKPRIDKKALIAHKNGLIVTSGCIESIINKKILNGDIKGAENEFIWFFSIFGEDFYVEIQDHGLEKQKIVNKYLLEWAKYYNVKVIGTNDTHYVNREDADLHDILLAIQSGKTVDDSTRLRFTDDNSNLCSEFYIKSYEEMMDIAVFKENPHFLENTLEVAEKCNAKINFHNSLMLPKFDTEGYTQDEYLEKKAKESLVQRFGDNVSKEIEERLLYELSVIKKLGFSGYFLIVQDIVNSARKNGVLVGPGRGSAVGSLVAYVLGITQLNPLQYGLFFERFLNPDRISPPDIDIDFDHSRRDEVLDYIRSRYNPENVAHISTFVFMGFKAAVRDALRSLGVPAQDINKFSSLLPSKIDEDKIDEQVLSPEYNPNADKVKSLIESDIRYKKAYEISKKIVGKPRQASIHASGVIISPERIDALVPLMLVTSDVKKTKTVATQFDMYDLEKFGLLKVDILGLNTLSIIHEVINDVKKLKNVDIDLYNLPLDDRNTWDLLKRASTKGIFQFESDGIKQVLREMQPDNINDLIAINALYRPGPLEQIPVYIRRKRGEEPVVYFHEKAEPILKETYGIMVYQEQIMMIAKELAGFTMAQADEFRRGIGKGEEEKITKNRQKFIDGCVKNGISEDKAKEIFELILKFAGYGFNKSHAAAYSYLAYATAFLKANYKEIFYKSLLNGHLTDYEEINNIVSEAIVEDLEVKMPDVNYSDYYFHTADGKIYHGLAAIRNIKSEHVSRIVEERKNKGLFSSLSDFLYRMVKYNIDKRTIEALIFSGALNSLIPSGFTPNHLYHEENINVIVEHYKELSKSYKKSYNLVSSSLFDSFLEVKYPELKLLDKKVSDDYIEDKLREYIGYDKRVIELNRNIFQEYEDIIKKYEIPVDYSTQPKERKSRSTLGIVLEKNERLSKKTGKKYYEITFLDKCGKFKGYYFENDTEVKVNDLCYIDFSIKSENAIQFIHVVKDHKSFETFMQLSRKIAGDKKPANFIRSINVDENDTGLLDVINQAVIKEEQNDYNPPKKQITNTNKVDKVETEFNQKNEEKKFIKALDNEHAISSIVDTEVVSPFIQPIWSEKDLTLKNKTNLIVLDYVRTILNTAMSISDLNISKDYYTDILDVMLDIMYNKINKGYFIHARHILYRIYEIYFIINVNNLRINEGLIDKMKYFIDKYNKAVRQEYF